MNDKKRVKVIVQGQVQGVGFRPFLWRLAHHEGLSGFCKNTSAGVEVEIEGNNENINHFIVRLKTDSPPLAKILNIEITDIHLTGENLDFKIIASENQPSQNVLVSPDIAICPDCVEDIRNGNNRRFHYAFTNCVNCGPRFSITSGLPYDRHNTVMKGFSLCQNCSTEYENPADRRFHAQPIACHQCGPSLWYIDAKESINVKPNKMDSEKALTKAAFTILNGGILALKGLGGFQLACDATKEKSVARLRILKKRPHKAFAIMVDSQETAAVFVDLNPLRIECLTGKEKPILLAPNKQNSFGQAPNLAPDSLFTGIMLPYTPLHVLLFDKLKELGMSAPCLVMTSGNAQGEPICLENTEAWSKLAPLCDGFLFHNREILSRVDDSVITINDNPWGWTADINSIHKEKIFFLRRARGYVPAPVASPFYTEKSVFGAGAELKATFSLSRGESIFTSQHIGDLSTPAALDFYKESLLHMKKLLEVEYSVILHDVHPNFISTQLAKELAAEKQLPIAALQHHAAHAAAVLAENNFSGPALVVCLDGTGMGLDDTIWGGEFIHMDLDKANWTRTGTFENFYLPGGEMAITEPWRIARALDPNYVPASKTITLKNLSVINEMVEKKINIFPTSSCGRFFDAVSARLGLCEQITYEGQAAIRLEKAARSWLSHNNFKTIPEISINIIKKDNLEFLGIKEFYKEISHIYGQCQDPQFTAAVFHWNLGRGISRMAIAQAEKLKVKQIGFSGGVTQNLLLLRVMMEEVARAGFTPLYHKNLPGNDACISYGQAVWGQTLLNNHLI